MKTIRFIFAVLLPFALAACQKPFEKEYGLEVDSNEYVVSVSGKAFPVYVYCSSAWTAGFDNPVDWAEITEGEHGSGVGMVRLHVKANYGEARSVVLVLKSGAYEQNVIVRQNAFTVDYYMTFGNGSLQLAAGSYMVRQRVTTNIPPEVIAASRAVTEAKWVSGITPYKVISDNQVAGTNRKVEFEFSFVVLDNWAGMVRTAVFDLGIPAEYTEGMERVKTLSVEQGAETASVAAVQPDAYTSASQECSVPLVSNIVPVYRDMIVLSDSDFVSGARVESDGQQLCLVFSLSENSSGTARSGKLVISYTDLNGTVTEAAVDIHQN